MAQEDCNSDRVAGGDLGAVIDRLPTPDEVRFEGLQPGQVPSVVLRYRIGGEHNEALQKLLGAALFKQAAEASEDGHVTVVVE